MGSKKRTYIIITIIFVCIFLFLFKVVRKWNERGGVFNTVKAVVVKVTFDNTNNPIKEKNDSYNRWQELIIRIVQGQHSGEVVMMRNTVELSSPYKIRVKRDQEILVSLTEENGKIINTHLFDICREKYIIYAVVVFFIALLLVGGVQGGKAIVTLLVTAALITIVLIPKILSGSNPMIITVLVCTCIVATTLTIIGGFNLKTYTAIIGTSLGVVIAGVFALIIGKLASISGIAYDDAHKLAYLIGIENKLDFRGIFFSSILIGSLGAVMDVSMSISSAMWEIKNIKADIKNMQLFKSGMNIGRDILGSMSNTLILAYTGGAMYLILIFFASDTGLREAVNLELVSSEILRAIVGSMGLTFTIPITAATFVLIPSLREGFRKKNRN